MRRVSMIAQVQRRDRIVRQTGAKGPLQRTPIASLSQQSVDDDESSRPSLMYRAVRERKHAPSSLLIFAVALTFEYFFSFAMEAPSVVKQDLTPEERSAKFREGVDGLFVLWAALDVMREAMPDVKTEWAIEDMFEGILEQFVFSGTKPKAKVSQTELEDMIFDFTAHDLFTDLEDGSVEQVADYTFKLFTSLCKNDLSVYEKLVAAAGKRRNAKKKPAIVKEKKAREPVAEDEEIVEGSGSEEEEEEGEDAAGNEEGNAGEKKEDKPKDEEDEWQVVGKKAHGNKKK